MTEVTQADRDAVYAWQNASDHAPNKLAHAFAKHREQAAAEERAKIMAWLREQGRGLNIRGQVEAWADQIEAGEHLE